MRRDLNWIIMPFIDNWEMTAKALQDCLLQTVPGVRILLIDQGSQYPHGAKALTQENPVLYYWHHDPPLLSLSATWNRALQMVWEAGCEHALVVNNDVRLHPETYAMLLTAQQETGALFVSATGTTPEQFQAVTWAEIRHTGLRSRGGPDFSCFLITQECHQDYPFDEGFIPAYCEDLDFHRRLMLDGKRDRIFSINVPFEHVGSGTLNQMDAQTRMKKEAQIGQGSRRHYEAKWGGPCNQERFARPFDQTSERDGVTTPDLQFAGVVGG